jgi:hypothetical protein
VSSSCADRGGIADKCTNFSGEISLKYAKADAQDANLAASNGKESGDA